MPSTDQGRVIDQLWDAAWAWPAAVTPSEWADQRRVLSRKASSEHGQWRTSRTPYLREVMDAFSVNDPTQEIVLVFASQTGKALDVATPIATPAGWTTMGALQAGDTVFDAQGQPTRVVSAWPVMHGRPCYRVVFSDGAEIVADAGHRWAVHEGFRNKPAVRTTQEILEIGLSMGTGGRYRFSVPVAGPLQTPAADLPIQPYALGVWLGDGNSYSAQITQHADDTPELVAALRACSEQVTVREVSSTVRNLALDLGAQRTGRYCSRGHDREAVGTVAVRRDGRVVTQRCSECHRQSVMASKYGRPMDPVLPRRLRFGERLQALGLMGKGRKRIPAAYLRASEYQRLELLRGLMDTDGHATTRGHAEFSQADPALAADVLELLRGLGFKPTAKRTSAATRISFTAYEDRPVFHLSRKRARLRPRGPRASETGARRIVAIEPVPSRPVRCIAVESPTHLFLAGRELIPTHNSEACNNCIGYALEVEPGPVLMVQPTLDLAKRYSKMRLGPMLEATPTLAELVKPSRTRDSGNTLLMKEFLNDGLLIVGGANAASGLASMPIRYAIEDEVDRFPLDVDGEGSPSDLIDARTRTFGARRKRLKTSTPTLAGQSRIWWEWERSDQRHYYVPCPHCGHKQVLTWEMMRYDPKDPALKNGLLSQPPVMICGECGTGIEERTKAWWYGEDLGEWIPENPDSPVRGYHLPGFYSPLGWLSWTEIVIDYEKKKDDEAKLKTWVNTVLAECWSEQGEAPPWEALYRRREHYPMGTVPEGGLILTAGCDVQRDRLEVEIVAWGPNLESWSVDYLVIPGDTGTIQESTSVRCPWRELSELLQTEWPCAGGGSMPLARLAVDSGDQTQVVYAWCRQQHDLRIMATKGRDQQVALVGLPSVQDVTIGGRKLKRSIKLWPLGVSTGKRELYSWLRQEAPLDPGEPLPRGWCHFPQYGEDFFLGLTAEELQMRKVRGFPRWEWVKVRPRNEQLDCRVMARAALATLGADRWTPEEWADRAARLGARMQRAKAAPAATAKATDQQAPKGERKRRGGWLSGSKRGLSGGGWLS